jgi:hypothetical protein
MTAARSLTPVIASDDPLWRKFLAAPVDLSPLSDEELAWLAQAKAGGVVSGASLSAEIARRAEGDLGPNCE